MKKKKILYALLAAFNMISFASCESGNVDTSSEVIQTTRVTFKNQEFTYDGEEKYVYVSNLPEDASVRYEGNGNVKPGNYSVKAYVTYADGKEESFMARMTIKKAASNLTAESVQTAYNYYGAIPTYSIDNDTQEIVFSPIYRPGSYQVEIYAKENEYYLESNHVMVDFTVYEGNELNIDFSDVSVNVDGNIHSIQASNIPAGYSVSYENNEASEPGIYRASCHVKNENDETVLTLTALLTISNPVNEEFNDYLDQFFLDYLGDDYLSWNILTVDPTKFGYQRNPEDEAKWYTYESIGDTYKQEVYDEMVTCHNMLLKFKDSPLSYEQQISYKVIDDFFKENIEFYDPSKNYNELLALEYIDQFGGYASNFTQYIESYSLHSEQEIKDLLSYIKSLPEAFASYIVYANDRIKANYPLSDYTIDEMISYLDSVSEQGDDYYLGELINNKIDDCSFLTNEQKEGYKELVVKYMKDYFMTAHKTFASDLKTVKGHCEKSGYLAEYGEVGKSHFEYELTTLLNIDNFDLDAYENELYEAITYYSDKANKVVKQARQDDKTFEVFVDYVYGYPVTGLTDPEKMIDYLKEFATTIVPTLDNTPEITIKYMDDASAEVSNAVAYYMKSPLDGGEVEYITLNGKQLSSDLNDTLSTMAHEGYPGHLYSYIFSKQLNISNVAKIMTSTAHAEGWATYVQIKLFEYLTDHNSQSANRQKAVKYYVDYSIANQMIGYLLYTYADYMMHIKGYSVSEIGDLMDDLGFDGSMAEELYYTLAEMPAGYAAYGYGMLFFYNLHEDAKARLGNIYDEIEYNTALLSNGWCSLGEVKRISEQYIENTLHKYSHQ